MFFGNLFELVKPDIVCPLFILKYLTHQRISFTWREIHLLQWLNHEVRIFSPVHDGCFKDTYREKALSNKTPALTKSTNMDIWVVGISNQRFTRGS